MGRFAAKQDDSGFRARLRDRARHCRANYFVYAGERSVGLVRLAWNVRLRRRLYHVAETQLDLEHVDWRNIQGAMPPVIGYCAVTNEIDAGAWILFAFLFLYSSLRTSGRLRLEGKEEYRAAGFRYCRS